MPIALAIGSVVASGIGAAANISAANKVSKTARDTAAANNALQQNIYNENKATLQPFVNTGNKATQSIEALLGLGGDANAANSAFDGYKTSTQYSSRFNEGSRAVTAALGGKGLLDSGAAQKALLKYGQTFASNEFGNYMGNLQTQQQTGLGAAAALTGNGQNYANAVSNNNNQAADIQSRSALSNAASIGGLLTNALSTYGALQGFGSSYGGSVLSGRSKNSYGVLGSGGIY